MLLYSVEEAESAIVPARRALFAGDRPSGLLYGAFGVLLFSLTLPMTKLALRGFDPWFIASGRAVVAAGLGAATLRLQRARRPTRRELRRLAVVAAGVVLGFPVLSSLALTTTSATHAAVVIALLPAATAVAGVVRSREIPSRAFWLAAAAGTTVVLGWALARAGGGLRVGDAYLLVGVALCAVGYAEGAVTARSLGSAQTICWALLIAAPVTVPLAAATAPGRTPTGSALAGLLYVSVGSMFLGFFAWYAGLARGGVARISQIQLVQTPLSLAWSALILGERLTWSTALVAAAVVATVAAAQRSRVERAPEPAPDAGPPHGIAPGAVPPS